MEYNKIHINNKVLYGDNICLINKLLKKYRNEEYFEDLIQECLLAIEKKKHLFDESKGKWATFIAQVIKWIPFSFLGNNIYPVRLPKEVLYSKEQRFNEFKKYHYTELKQTIPSHNTEIGFHIKLLFIEVEEYLEEWTTYVGYKNKISIKRKKECLKSFKEYYIIGEDFKEMCKKEKVTSQGMYDRFSIVKKEIRKQFKDEFNWLRKLRNKGII